MDRTQILRLMQVRDYPAVSILCPTHRTSPDNRRDPIQLKELVREARDRLLAEFDRRRVEPIIRRIEALASAVDHTYNLDGLVIFVNDDLGEVHRLPFRVEPRVVVDETFATRDLVYALNRSQRYRILLLDPRRTRLFEGSGRQVSEVVGDIFPLEPEDKPERSPDAWWGINPDSVHDTRRRQFAKEIAAAIDPIQDNDPLPLVLIGSDLWIPLFRGATRHDDQVIGTVVGNFPRVTLEFLADQAVPVVREWRDRERARHLEKLEVAVGANRYASGVDQVWRQIRRGRGRILLVEEGYRRAARLHRGGVILEWAEDKASPDVIDDIVDEIIEGVIAQGGEVLFYPDGALGRHQRIALMT